MNLHGIAGNAVSAVNPWKKATISRSNGYDSVNFKQVPKYLQPEEVLVQSQSLTYNDLLQTDGLNVQGERKALYMSGNFNGVQRAEGKGGDILTIDGIDWLVAMVLESWPDWCKLCVTRQMP